MNEHYDFSYAGQDYRVQWSPIPGGQWQPTLSDSEDRNLGSWLVERQVVGEHSSQTPPLLARLIANLSVQGIHLLPKGK